MPAPAPSPEPGSLASLAEPPPRRPFGTRKGWLVMLWIGSVLWFFTGEMFAHGGRTQGNLTLYHLMSAVALLAPLAGYLTRQFLARGRPSASRYLASALISWVVFLGLVIGAFAALEWMLPPPKPPAAVPASAPATQFPVPTKPAT